MTWWQWLMLFLAVCLWPLSILAAVVIGGKLARGEEIQIKRTPPPSPVYNDPAANNRLKDQLAAQAARDRVRNVKEIG